MKKKVRHSVATVFKCLFCNHEASVQCKLNLTSMVGELVCRICDAKFETQINTLTDPIDVFSEWLDEANELQEEEQRRQMQGLPGRQHGFVGDGRDYVDDGKGDMGEQDDSAVVAESDGANGDNEGPADGDTQPQPSASEAGYVDADDDL